MISLNPVDTVLILLYFVAVVAIGFIAARRTRSTAEDYLLAGRSLTLPLFVMTLVSTWYGGILGVGEFSYLYGISNWIVMGVPYYVFAAFFAFFLAAKIRATNLFSIPDKLQLSYDRKTALLGSVLTFILMNPAPYVLMFAIIMKLLFDWSLAVSIVAAAIVAFSYLMLGGFRSDIATDVFEFVLMFAGFAVIIPFSIHTFGGWEFLSTNLPPLHLTWHGGHTVQFILVWFFIALWTIVDPAFHQRCYAAKDGATARKGIFVSIIFWLFFDAMTATAGLYARAALPDLTEPMMAYPLLAERVLPPIAKGLFYIGMLATMMSTMNTLGLVSAQTIGRDIILRLRRRPASVAEGITDTPEDPLAGKSATTYTRIGLLISFFIAVIFALALPSVIEIWYTIGTIVIPGLLVPLVASYFDRLRISAYFAFRSMLFGWLTSIVWLISGELMGVGGHAQYPLGIEPMYPGLLVSLTWWVIGRRAAKSSIITR